MRAGIASWPRTPTAASPRYEYDAFGQPRFYNAWGQELGGSARSNRFLFTGREWLHDLWIYDYRHRLYHPELGRFLQPDPLQFKAGDYNLYRYCHNDPINRADPSGLVDLTYTPAHEPGRVWEDSFNPRDRFTVAGHANSKGFQSGQRILTTNEVAADMIAKGYTPGKDVLLVGCETGRGKASFADRLAQTLAKMTGVETKVQAPTTLIQSGASKGAEPTVLPDGKGQAGELKTFIGKPAPKPLPDKAKQNK